MNLYPWIVIAHVLAVIVVAGAHGVSVFAMFQARREADRTRLAAILDLSAVSVGATWIGLLLALLIGIVASVMGSHFSRAWPWAAIAILVVVSIAMTPLAAGPMAALRRAIGQPDPRARAGVPAPTPGTDSELAAARAALRPELVATIGLGALVVLVWLMEAKPF